ncbi:XRE family transcriptional regulator [Micromonospora sp. NPDC000207]|uniref:XRE family transcriptional regulator n=1 Tax=Micromonospora sp. NPDC000207 TaxID=3154246 RepID=UPI00332D9903
MRRRNMLAAMGALAAAPAVAELTGWEALRHGLTSAADGDVVGEWRDIVAGYGRDYYGQPHSTMLSRLRGDLDVLAHQLAAVEDERRGGLLAAAAQLSTLAALAWVAAGDQSTAARWWSTARRTATESGDATARTWVTGWDVITGCYDGREPGALVELADSAGPARSGAASAGLLCGRAQALALAGRHAEAVATVRQMEAVTEAMPASEAEVTSLWGWPEHRLWHTASWVHTYAGDSRRAGESQDRAVSLYPEAQRRLRAQVELHRAAGLVRDGHVSEGVRHAVAQVDGLPAAERVTSLRVVAGRVIEAVPLAERRRPQVAELRELTAA